MLTHHWVALGVAPEASLGWEGHHGVGRGAPQQRLQSVSAGGPRLVVAGHVAPLVVQSVTLQLVQQFEDVWLPGDWRRRPLEGTLSAPLLL